MEEWASGNTIDETGYGTSTGGQARHAENQFVQTNQGVWRICGARKACKQLGVNAAYTLPGLEGAFSSACTVAFGCRVVLCNLCRRLGKALALKCFASAVSNAGDHPTPVKSSLVVQSRGSAVRLLPIGDSFKLLSAVLS